MDPATVLAIVLLGTGTALAVTGAVRWWRERRYLAGVLEDVVEGGWIRDRDDLVRLKRHLSRRIRWDPARQHEPRPLLRARAADVLRSGYGFCGENARTAVRLLRLGGVRAHRLYLEGRRWGHVVVEHRWNGDWRLFDAHDDPATALDDDAVGRIDTTDPDSFPNRVEENPWIGAHRLPLPGPLRRIDVLSELRPPGLLAAVAESPDAIRTITGFFIMWAGALLL